MCYYGRFFLILFCNIIPIVSLKICQQENVDLKLITLPEMKAHSHTAYRSQLSWIQVYKYLPLSKSEHWCALFTFCLIPNQCFCFACIKMRGILPAFWASRDNSFYGSHFSLSFTFTSANRDVETSLILHSNPWVSVFLISLLLRFEWVHNNNSSSRLYKKLVTTRKHIRRVWISGIQILSPALVLKASS